MAKVERGVNWWPAQTRSSRGAAVDEQGSRRRSEKKEDSRSIRKFEKSSAECRLQRAESRKQKAESRELNAEFLGVGLTLNSSKVQRRTSDDNARVY